VTSLASFARSGRAAAAWLPLAAGLGLAALWPLTAYAVSPAIVPGLVVVTVIAALTVWRPEYGLAFVLALTPLINIETGGGSRLLQLFLPGVAFAVLLYGILVSPSRRENASSWLTAGVLVFVAAGVAASAQALDPGASVGRVFRLLTAAAVYLAVLHICRERRQLVTVVAGAVAGLFIASAQGVAQNYLGLHSTFSFVADDSVVERVQGSFGHPNEYGGFLAVLVPVAAAVVVTRRIPTAVRLLAGAAVALALPALAFSYARAAIAAVVLGSLVWLAVLRPRLTVPVAVVVAVTALTLAPPALKERFQETSGEDVALRSDIWGAALDIYSQRPILGVGLNNFSEAYSSLPTTLADASQRRLLHAEQILVPPYAENLYLNILAEEGIVGIAAFALFAFVAAGVVYRACGVRDPVARSLSFGIGAGFATVALHSVFQVTLIGELALPFFALLAVAAGFVALDQEARRLPAGRLSQR
jgi:O-antigen ligase